MSLVEHGRAACKVTLHQSPLTFMSPWFPIGPEERLPHPANLLKDCPLRNTGLESVRRSTLWLVLCCECVRLGVRLLGHGVCVCVWEIEKHVCVCYSGVKVKVRFLSYVKVPKRGLILISWWQKGGVMCGGYRTCHPKGGSLEGLTLNTSWRAAWLSLNVNKY